MEIRPLRFCLALSTWAFAASAPAVRAQDPAGPAPGSSDPVVSSILADGIEHSRLESLAHALLDSIGPRLAGTRGYDDAADWLVGRYEEWGIPVRKEAVGTWTGWRQGAARADLVWPRFRTLEATPMAYTAGTGGPVEGPVVILPTDLTEESAGEWLQGIEGAFVLAMPAEPSCRARQELEANARPGTVARLDSTRAAIREEWFGGLQALGGPNPWRALARLAEGRPAGVVMSWWSEGWGANKIFEAPPGGLPAISLSCEDYGLLHRLASRGEPPRIRVDIDAELLGEVPHHNVIAEIRGTELPDEYVVLSAHLDSWHAASGATDNGTGTLMVLEAMRLLKESGAAPRRTIIAGHWAGEEVGMIGSLAFTEDHPEVVDGLQAAFNQDNGTWRIERIEAQGFARAGERIADWMSRVPGEISDRIVLEFPGGQENRGSDHTSFVCRGAPGFRLQSPYDEYRQYTWHTELDTYDKLVFEDLRENAALAAILAWAAAEDSLRTPRDRAELPVDPRTGEPRAWLECGAAMRSPPASPGP